MKKRSILIIGPESSGKTTLMNQFREPHNQHKDETIGLDFAFFHSKKIKYHLWEVSGQTRFSFIAKEKFKQIDSVIIMYDPNSSSHESFDYWYKQKKIYAKHLPCLMIANQSMTNPKNEKSLVNSNKYFNVRCISMDVLNNFKLNIFLYQLLNMEKHQVKFNVYSNKLQLNEPNELNELNELNEPRISSSCGFL